jgi:aminoglycoside phosphotransferase (APT) family kinase protein
MLDAVPEHLRESARAALRAAFGAAPVAALQPVAGGASGALTYRVEVGGHGHLLRMETRRDALRNPHQYTCMQIAAAAGIAPALRYVDEATGIAIMAFVPQRPLHEYPGGAARLARDVGGLIARLQATPSFPSLGEYTDILAGMLAFLRSAGVFAAGLLDPLEAGFRLIREAYPWRASASVSSHNDPNPRNVLFDGERLWLVDWETSYRNDPFTDVAVVSNELAATPELEDALLAGWLGRPPDRVERARLLLMRQLTRLYYGGIIFSAFAASPGAPPLADLRALTPDEFRTAVAQGRLRLGAPETLHELGKLILAAFLAELSAPPFDEALRIVRGSGSNQP